MGGSEWFFGYPSHFAAFYDFKSSNNIPLVVAAEQGHLDCVKFLLSFSSREREDGGAIYEAAINNRQDVALFLAGYETPEHVTRGLGAALRRGNISLAEKLMPFALIDHSDEVLLSQAVESGDINTVRFILPFVNTLTEHGEPLESAVSLGHNDIFHLLLPP